MKVLTGCNARARLTVDTFIDSAPLCFPNPLIGGHPEMEPMAGIGPVDSTKWTTKEATKVGRRDSCLRHESVTVHWAVLN